MNERENLLERCMTVEFEGPHDGSVGLVVEQRPKDPAEDRHTLIIDALAGVKLAAGTVLEYLGENGEIILGTVESAESAPLGPGHQRMRVVMRPNSVKS